MGSVRKDWRKIMADIERKCRKTCAGIIRAFLHLRNAPETRIDPTQVVVVAAEPGATVEGSSAPAAWLLVSGSAYVHTTAFLSTDFPDCKIDKVKAKTVGGQFLEISGVWIKEEEGPTNDSWHRVEKRTGKFQRQFELPENANADKAKAKMKDGVLTVTVPVKKVKAPKEKPIKIST